MTQKLDCNCNESMALAAFTSAAVTAATIFVCSKAGDCFKSVFGGNNTSENAAPTSLEKRITADAADTKSADSTADASDTESLAATADAESTAAADSRWDADTRWIDEVIQSLSPELREHLPDDALEYLKAFEFKTSESKSQSLLLKSLESLNGNVAIVDAFLKEFKRNKRTIQEFKGLLRNLPLPVIRVIGLGDSIRRIEMARNKAFIRNDPDYEALNNYAPLAEAAHHLHVVYAAAEIALTAKFINKDLKDMNDVSYRESFEGSVKTFKEKNDQYAKITGLYEKNPFTKPEHFIYPNDKDSAQSIYEEFTKVAQAAAEEARKLAPASEDQDIQSAMDGIATFCESHLEVIEDFNDDGGKFVYSIRESDPESGAGKQEADPLST